MSTILLSMVVVSVLKDKYAYMSMGEIQMRKRVLHT